MSEFEFDFVATTNDPVYYYEVLPESVRSSIANESELLKEPR